MVFSASFFREKTPSYQTVLPASADKQRPEIQGMTEILRATAQFCPDLWLCPIKPGIVFICSVVIGIKCFGATPMVTLGNKPPG